jgi:hypothetical protein
VSAREILSVISKSANLNGRVSLLEWRPEALAAAAG